MATETEYQLLQKAVGEALADLEVHVIAGSLIGDEIVRKLSKTGVQDILDRLHARDFSIARRA